MKAPDKIYLHPDIGGKEFIRPWLHRAANSESVAYIRKNALLEWAKEHKRVIETHGDERDAYLRGEYSVLNSLIDKIESL